ncbi:hypothetical protein EDB83DRAFT_2358318 [Lactarius deliciosus]|nr:hypothetical protein EDB83DRAFT_2358318 [Lactarius deliciosus]
MCVDRCLICLEDYDPEEDPRLLSYRHVFRRDCVDRWRRAAITVPRVARRYEKAVRCCTEFFLFRA